MDPNETLKQLVHALRYRGGAPFDPDSALQCAEYLRGWCENGGCVPDDNESFAKLVSFVGDMLAYHYGANLPR